MKCEKVANERNNIFINLRQNGIGGCARAEPLDTLDTKRNGYFMRTHSNTEKIRMYMW